MRTRHLILTAMIVPAVVLAAGHTSPSGSDSPDNVDDSIRPIPYSQVDITDSFWSQKIQANRTVSIQHVFDRSEERGNGGPAQLIEAAAYMLAKRPDAALEHRVDALIDRFART